MKLYTGWLKKSKLLSQYNSLLFWATLYITDYNMSRFFMDHSVYCAQEGEVVNLWGV